MHLELGEIDVSSELEMGGHPVPQACQPFKLKFSAHLVLDVLIKKVCPAPPASATVNIELYLGRVQGNHTTYSLT